MKNYLTIALLLLAVVAANAQVGIGTTTPKSTLDIPATNNATPTNTDGILIPRINAFPLTNPTIDQNGMMVFLTLDLPGKPKGFYYWDDATTAWIGIGTRKGWELTGNAVSDTLTNFLGTTNAVDLIFKRNGLRGGRIGATSTSLGMNALSPSSFGANHTAVGKNALNVNAFGTQNSAFGSGALQGNTDGNQNTAVGYEAGKLNTTGSNNITLGANSNVPVQTASNQLSIGNVIYGTTMTSAAAGKIGIGEVAPNAKLQISSATPATPANTDGIIIPRVSTLTAAGSMTAAQKGMMVFLTTLFSGNQPGFYYWDDVSNSWKGVGSGTANGWGLTGNSGTNPSTNFIGTTDPQDIVFRRNNLLAGKIAQFTTSIGNNSMLISTGGNNTTFGNSIMINNTTGSENTAMGSTALLGNTIGSNNIGIGYGAMTNNNAAGKNVAIGNNALFSQNFANSNVPFDTNNVAIGHEALYSNNQANAFSDGYSNTAIGSEALRNNSTGNTNTAIGYRALLGGSVASLNTGSINVAVGGLALQSNTAGHNNIGVGYYSLAANTIGDRNIGIGNISLQSNTTASRNTAIGYGALGAISFSNGGVAFDTNNVAIGYYALGSLNPTAATNGINNTVIGNSAAQSNSTGAGNVAMGTNALMYGNTGGNNVAIGFEAIKGAIGPTSGDNNVGIGSKALLGNTTGSNNIGIGANTDVPNGTASNQMNIGNVIYGTTMTSTAAGKIGIGEVAPSAKFQISSATPATPLNTDGVIIPRVSSLTAAVSMTAAQNGMMVYLTADLAGKPKGFYYWESVSATWKGVGSSSDGAFYEVGTTTPPDAITDNMYHTGNVGIGVIAPNEKLQVSDNVRIGSIQWASAANDRYLKWGDGNFVTIGEEVADDMMSLKANNFLFNPSGAYTGYAGFGLGTVLPSEMLQVGENIKIGRVLWTSAANNRFLKFGDGDNVTIGEEISDDMMSFKAKNFVFNPSGAYTGNVGIGLNGPLEKLQVAGNLKLGNLAWGSAADNRLLKFGDGNFVTVGEEIADDMLSFKANNFLFNASGGYDGNVGIGVTAATEKLEVAGKTKTTNLQVTTGAAFGSVLVSDVVGNANWSSVNAIAWGLQGNSGINPAVHFIGTTTNTDFVIKRNSIRAGYLGYTETAFGHLALNNYTPAMGSNFNSAFGYKALEVNTGVLNTAIGYATLAVNVDGGGNTAIGTNTMDQNITGDYNTAVGKFTASRNISGNFNSSLGDHALYSNQTGSNNVAIGHNALHQIPSGDENTAIGANTFVTTTAYSRSTAIGANCAITASDIIRLGVFSTASIGGFKDWTNVSDKRFKKDIQENVPGLEFIKRLKPVTYHLDSDRIAGFLKTPDSLRNKSVEVANTQLETGFLAQDVAQAARDLGYDFSGVDQPKNDGDYYGLRYATFVVPLVKAVQEQQQIIDAQKAQNEKLQQEIEALKGNQQTLEERLKAIENKLNK